MQYISESACTDLLIAQTCGGHCDVECLPSAVVKVTSCDWGMSVLVTGI
jgi:hypothetical protein